MTKQNVLSRNLRALACLLLAVALGVNAPAATKSSSSKKTTSSKSTSGKSGGSSKSSSGKSTTAKKTTSKSSSKSQPAKTVTKSDPITSSTTATLPALLDAAIARVSGASQWGVSVGVLETGETIYQKNQDRLFIPASNRKIFTGAFVLDQLGPDFQYHTYLYRTGSVDAAGTLQGNLVIQPQGDPTFSNELMRQGPSDWIFRDWVQKVKAQNIKSVQGDLIVDCSAWRMGDLTPKGWTASVSDQYSPNASPLTLNHNKLQFRVKAGESGKPGIIEFVPAAEGYPIINNTVTGGKGGIRIKWAPDGSIEVSGAVPSKGTSALYDFPADNPTLFAAAVLRSHLRTGGIDVSGAVRLVVQPNTLPPPTADNVVALYKSPPMADLLRYMMKESENHFAEQMYVSVSAIKAGAGGYSTSKAMERAFLKRLGIDTTDLNFEDGCGLSRMNAVSPSHVRQILSSMMHHPSAQLFFDSMAVSGRDGTLRGRMRGTPAAERVHAKTGHINNVSTLSGYVRLQPNATLVFSMLVNNMRTHVDATQDRICELLSLLVI